MWVPVRQKYSHCAHGKPIKNNSHVKIHAAQDCSQTFHLRFATAEISMKLPYQQPEHSYTHIT